MNRRVSRISYTIVRGVLRALEFALVATTGMVAAAFYVSSADLWQSSKYFVALASAGFLTLAAFELLGLYRQSSFGAASRAMPRVVLGWTAAIAVLMAGAFFLKTSADFSRLWLAMWYMSGAVALIAGRLGLGALAKRWAGQGRFYRRAIIYGTGPACEEFIAALDRDKNSDVRICGIFDDRLGDRALAQIHGYPHLGNIENLISFVRATRVDVIVLTIPPSAKSRLINALRKLSELPVDIRLASTATKLRFRPRAYSYLGNVQVIDLADQPITDWNFVAKSAFDKAVALMALIALAPLMIATAIAIRLESRGPILFRQKRYGFNNELIEVLKFRSMYVDRCDQNAATLVTRDDPRVTGVGRFIRKTSIDELPQLINVLCGELSLVGPRPHALHAKAADKLYDEAVEGYSAATA